MLCFQGCQYGVLDRLHWLACRGVVDFLSCAVRVNLSGGHSVNGINNPVSVRKAASCPRLHVLFRKPIPVLDYSK
jgi:hypothetical protein